MSDDQSYAPWSDLNHDVLNKVMMQLGVVEFVSLSGVCKSWRSLALSNRDTFMASTPPMSMTINGSYGDEKACFLEDFEGRKFKTTLPWFSAVDDCVGLTCGYLVFFLWEIRDFRLVNPITRHQLHFPDFPTDDNYRPERAILVFSASISKWVFVVLLRYSYRIWFCIAGERTWNDVSYRRHIRDLHALKGKIYVQTSPFSLLELRLDASHPKLTPLEIIWPAGAYLDEFVGSCERLYVIGWDWDRDQDHREYLRELELGEMKRVKVKACEQTLEEYAFFYSEVNRHVVALKRESWADPRSRSHGRYAYTHNIRRFITANMWYFPLECLNVDLIAE